MDEIHNSDNTLRSRVDGYGFDRSDDQHAEAIDKFMASYLSILARRASRWNNLLSSGERISKNRKLKRFCRKGIPNEHRKTMWMLLSGAEEKRKANPRTYRLLLDSQKDERVVETIALDLHRTFPENIFFSSEDGLQRPLRNVLVAASLYNPDKGYSQIFILLEWRQSEQNKSCWVKLLDGRTGSCMTTYRRWGFSGAWWEQSGSCAYLLMCCQQRLF